MDIKQDLKKVVREELGRHLEDHSDLRTKIPSLVLIYPLDQGHIRSGFVGQKWMLKLCCMFPGVAHTLGGGDDLKENETNPALGWYQLDDLGEWTAPVIKWMKGNEKIIKVLSPRLGRILEWIHQDEVTSYLKSHSDSVKDLNLPESNLPKGGSQYLPVSSEMITLAGLDETDYRRLEGQGLIFLQGVFQKFGQCGNLHLFVNNDGRKLWLCKEHHDRLTAERDAAEPVMRKRGLNELLKVYETQLESKVSRVKIFGDTAPYPLEKVFVELTINEEYDRRAGDSQYLGLLDAELRRLRSVFGDVDEVRDSNDSDPLKSIFGKTKIKPDELISRSTHAIITGAPGCGKTTLLRYLSWQTLKQWRAALSDNGSWSSNQRSDSISKPDARFPIFLELKQLQASAFAQAQDHFEDLLFEKAIVALVKPQDEAECVTLKHHFRELLGAGRVAIFLDGLDEVSGTTFFNALQSSVSAFLQSAYGGNLVLISTRPFALRQLGDAQLMEIAPFDSSKIEQFIQHYYGDVPERKQFQKELQRRRELRELARVPALLGFILQMWRKHGLVSDNKLELYEAVSREQAQQLDSDKEGVPPERKWLVADPDGSLKLHFMRQLAFETLFKGVINLGHKVSADLDRLVFTSDTILKTARHFADRVKQQEGMPISPRHLAEDAKATALLRQVGADKYAFTHLTLHEYLAAVELAEHEDCERIFCRAYFNLTLVAMEVLPMTLGAVNNAEDLYQVVGRLPDSINFTGLHLLARGLDYGALISDDGLLQLAKRLTDFICQSEINLEESEFVRSFAWLRKQPSYYENFLPLLKCEDSAVRGRVATLLGVIGSEKVVPELLNALSDEENHVRNKVAEALGRIGYKRAVSRILISLDESPENYHDYIKALYKLGHFKHEQYQQALIKKVIELVTKSDFNNDIKALLIRDLSTEGLSDFLRGVIKRYCEQGIDRANTQILLAACEVSEELYRQGHPPSVSTIVYLSEKCRSPEACDRAAALLQEIGQEQVVELLHKELAQANEVKQREQAALALMRTGQERSVGALLNSLSDVSKPVRWKVMIALGQMKPEVIASGLLRAMSHEDDLVRAKAAEVVGYYTISGVKQELLRLANDDPNDEVRKTAQEALQKFERKLHYFDIPIADGENSPAPSA